MLNGRLYQTACYTTGVADSRHWRLGGDAEELLLPAFPYWVSSAGGMLGYWRMLVLSMPLL
jgi:hypothetical protein